MGDIAEQGQASLRPKDIERHIARFANLKPFEAKYPGGYKPEGITPEYTSESLKVLGLGKAAAMESGGSQGGIVGDHDFAMNILRIPTGGGTAPHSHTTSEYFMPLNGAMHILWGPTPEDSHRVVLNKWDVIFLPGNVMRWFYNPNEDTLYSMVLLTLSTEGIFDVALRSDVIELAERLGRKEAVVD